MDTHSAEIVEGLLKWWDARFGIVIGSRNANLYKLAAAFNNYGIPQLDALSVCLRFVDNTGQDPLTASEITNTVASAYRRTEHGVRSWKSAGSHRDFPKKPPPRVLSPTQARAVEDHMVGLLVRRFQPVPLK